MSKVRIIVVMVFGGALFTTLLGASVFYESAAGTLIFSILLVGLLVVSAKSLAAPKG